MMHFNNAHIFAFKNNLYKKYYLIKFHIVYILNARPILIISFHKYLIKFKLYVIVLMNISYNKAESCGATNFQY